MSDLLFEMWLRAHGFDQEVWLPGLLRALRRRYERSLEKIVIDGRDCQWPQRVHRVNEVKEIPR
jgi:hypothetical protein